MAYHKHGMSATFVPGMDDFWQPTAPDLVAPEPQRINPEMSNQIAGGIQKLDLNARESRNSLGNAKQTHQYGDLPISHDIPHLSPFPKLPTKLPNVPPSDEELEATLEDARALVLNSNDPEMQLAWAADALVYVGVCADNEERIAASKPNAARPATPRVEHQLKVDAMNITTFLADQHHPKAEFLKGMWLEWGRFGQREDKKEAFRCYSRAADRGYARAEYRIGMLYESYNDPIKALRHYHRGVDAGDAASCYRLGMMTLRGQHGQQQDFARAVDLIRKSAEAADENAAQGAYVYGMLLARQLPQIEVPEGYLAFDERQARMNIEKAAYLKFAKAQLKMGSAYELGSLGCEFNPALSMHYNALASKQGEAEADMALSKWFLVGSEGLFPKNEDLAYTYAERASQSGLATAEFAMGYFNEIGMNVPTNLDKAMEWYQKASKHGNADAQGRIEGLSKKQVLSKKDHENVAISRIKSQYGSMRGSRPDRFRQQQQPSRLGQVDEASNGAMSPPQMGGAIQPPARGTTPYPEDNNPLNMVPANNRPASVAPYPLEDGPPSQQRLGPAGGFFNVQQQPPRPATTLNPELRPSSAFQINPDLNRPNSMVDAAQPPYAGGRPPYGSNLAPGPQTLPAFRPATTQPYTPGSGARPPMGNRIVSGPAGVPNQNQPYPPYQQQGTPQPPQAQRPPMPQSTPTAPAVPQTQPQSQQALDIGFSAPFEDRRRNYGPPGRPPTGIQPQAQPHASPALRPTDVVPEFDKPAPLRPQKQQQPKPSSTPNPSGAAATKPKREKDYTVPTKPGAIHAATAPAAPTTKPGKGPKTFDEMGVPQTKQDSDCVVM